MLGKILPLVLLLVGAGAGVGAGIFLRPAPEEMAADAEMEKSEKDGEKKSDDKKDGKKDGEKGDKKDGDKEGGSSVAYVKLSNQFVVPVVKQEEVVSMVVLSLSLEVTEGSNESVFRREPKLRDSFLQVLFDHANIGGFDGAFTEANNLSVLRAALREAGQSVMDKETIKDVLILEIARQDY